MTVYFIGAGPGDPDLLTIKGRDLIARCPVCLYAGSLVPETVVAHAPDEAKVIDTAAMTLDEILADIEAAHAVGHDVARVHSGDPSLYGAIAEQSRRLRGAGIPFEIIPGVPAYTAAAAALEIELTLPEISPDSDPDPDKHAIQRHAQGEELEELGRSKATLAIHLSIRNLRYIERALIPHYGADCPVAVIYRASWPDQQIIRGTLSDIRRKVRDAKITRTALIMVGRVLDAENFRDSALYDAEHTHVLRPEKKEKKRGVTFHTLRLVIDPERLSKSNGTLSGSSFLGDAGEGSGSRQP